MKKITIVGLGNMGLNFINSVNKDFKKNISDVEINSLLFQSDTDRFKKFKK
ncbi:hypothetical protein ACN09M_01045 [Aliarcobacter butzleri]|uniref:Uncharacterized protein n=3 Tax=Arcobacteraceae TaxID=2808963 RepID=A0AA96DWD7_9BACT|nr:hypothetical protein RMP68_02445 [Arcobacter sp. AZ-2023]WNL36041.1 hypothetical protein RMQ66_10190 [Arcobacter sp. AZ-2023]WPD11757.1 hypothetical protein QT384_10190 [Arcobacter sp. DSM 115960]